jgi:uncharacterized protein YcbK (DUF882 family)
MKKIYCINRDTKIRSPYFTAAEMASKDGAKELLLSEELLEVLVMIRDNFKKPVIVNSGYRTPAWNTKVGGAGNSYHCKGMAADIRIKDVSPKEIAKFASEYMKDHGGVICYTNFVHVDVREGYYRKGV